MFSQEMLVEAWDVGLIMRLFGYAFHGGVNRL
jgi:hypothetical protein